MNGIKIQKIAAFAVFFLVSLAPALADLPETNTDVEIWRDPAQPIDMRVHDLVSRMTLEEKVSELGGDPSAVPRLGIPAYSHRNEGLHGVADGTATVFPEPIGMAATWDVPLIGEAADVISTEARAKSNDYAARHHDNRPHHFGLNYYSPNINIFRDPRWGRGQETYGEDPFLTSQFGVAYIRGLQGDDPRYVKILACAKHFAVHSGPETERHSMNPCPPERDLYETYLPAFEAAVREGRVGSVMGAYSDLYGTPDCANHFLLTDLLRKEWGFDGFVVSDGGAIWDIWAEHKYRPTPESAAAAAVKAGCDLCSGDVAPNAAAVRRSGDWTPDTLGWLHGGEDYRILTKAVADGLISEKEIDVAASRELTARFRLGMFDPPSMVSWSRITLADNDTPEHRALALKVAEESIVLLKNNGVLPLRHEKIKRIAVIGPNANSQEMLLGNYHGRPSRSITILSGIKKLAGAGIQVTYVQGCPVALKKDNSNQATPEVTEQAIAAAEASDIVIFVGGIDSSFESEEANDPHANFQGFYRGDRTKIELPSPQEELLKKLYETGRPVVFVNCSGSAMAMPWEAKNLSAIVQAWYPGEEGGLAVSEVLFGEVNPAGRLPITFYNSTKDLPAFDDYSMSNRTYRYFNGKPLFAFGHGLSYTKFKYSHPKLEARAVAPNGTIHLSFRIKNTGKSDGDEVAQVYFRHHDSTVPQPKLALCGFERVHLAKSDKTEVTVDIPAERFRYWDTMTKQYVVDPGRYDLLIGAVSDDIRLRVPLILPNSNQNNTVARHSGSIGIRKLAQILLSPQIANVQSALAAKVSPVDLDRFCCFAEVEKTDGR
jgi:beta-glucosidase